MLIKINRDTIKKNPNAGNTMSRVVGAKRIGFTIKGDLPNYLIEDENFYIISQDNYGTKECSLIDFSLLDKLLELKNISVTNKTDVQTFHHAPEKRWLFEYENPSLKCDSCDHYILLSDIKTEWDDEGEYEYDVCPQCNTINPFEPIEYENINDVVNKKAPN